MMTITTDPAAREFAVETFLRELRTGRADLREGESLRSELRMVGDVARLERVSKAIADRH